MTQSNQILATQINRFSLHACRPEQTGGINPLYSAGELTPAAGPCGNLRGRPGLRFTFGSLPCLCAGLPCMGGCSSDSLLERSECCINISARKQIASGISKQEQLRNEQASHILKRFWQYHAKYDCWSTPRSGLSSCVA